MPFIFLGFLLQQLLPFRFFLCFCNSNCCRLDFLLPLIFFIVFVTAIIAATPSEPEKISKSQAGLSFACCFGFLLLCMLVDRVVLVIIYTGCSCKTVNVDWDVLVIMCICLFM